MCKSPDITLFHLYHSVTARSHFDLHSPFVYNLYSEVLKDKRKHPGYYQLDQRYDRLKYKKYHHLLFRLSAWFKPSVIFFTGREGSPEQLYLQSGFPEGKISSEYEIPGKPFNMIFLDLQTLKEPAEKCFSRLQQHITGDSVFILWSIKDPLALKKTWNLFQTLPGITVTIDLFCVGLVFVNRNLSREDFKIRF
jgi:hypothetical protein